MGFDGSMLVRGNALLRDLAANPIGFFRQNDAQSVSERGQGGRASAQTASRDDDIRGQLVFTLSGRNPARRRRVPSGQRKAQGRWQSPRPQTTFEENDVGSCRRKLFSKDESKSSPESSFAGKKSSRVCNPTKTHHC